MYHGVLATSFNVISKETPQIGFQVVNQHIDQQTLS